MSMIKNFRFIMNVCLGVIFVGLLSACGHESGDGRSGKSARSPVSPIPEPSAPDSPAQVHHKLAVQIDGGGQVLVNYIQICDQLHSPCEYSMPSDQSAHLSVYPTAMVAFNAWENCPSEAVATACIKTLNSDETVLAHFSKEPESSEVLPVLSINDSQAAEGDILTFSVSLSEPATYDVRFNYFAVDGSAVQGANFENASGSVHIPIGESSATISIPSLNDGLYLPSLQFSLVLISPVHATIGNGVAQGTILNINPMPVLPILSVSDVTALAGGVLDFRISLSSPSEQDVSFNYLSQDNTAISGINYTAETGVGHIPPGATEAHVLVQTIATTTFSEPITFFLKLLAPVNADLGNTEGLGTINPLPVDGACGLADGSALEVDPAADLCVSGSASSIAGDGPWTWSCLGQAGGGSATCSASILLSHMDEQTIQTRLNTPVSFTGTLIDSHLFSGVYLDSNLGTQANNALGTLTVTDPTNLKFTFSPALNARGNTSFMVYVMSGQKVTTSKITISIDNTLANLQPGVAVRASACMNCHSNIQSNFITDFGFGDSYFFGQRSNNPWDFGSVYGNHDGNWQNSKINGAIIVPRNALVSSSLKNSLSFSVPSNQQPSIVTSVANFLRWYQSLDATSKMKAPILEEPSIYIGAPSATRLREVANKTATDGIIKFFPESNSSPALSGFVITPGTRPNGTTGTYVTNTPNIELICNGDVFIDAPLFLNQPVINTQKGCRIYSTQSVLIRAPIRYAGGSATPNLQISSAKAILAGLGWNDCGINWRDDTPGLSATINHSVLGRLRDNVWTNPNTFVRDMTTSDPQDFINSIHSDAMLVPRDQLIDAVCQTDNSFSLNLTATIKKDSNIITVPSTSQLQLGMRVSGPDIPVGSAIGNILSGTKFKIRLGTQNEANATLTSASEPLTITDPRNIPLEHVLLNAPIVHSRYSGNVSGVIVAEFALMSLGDFSYSFDPTFLSVPVLPILSPSDYLDVQLSGGTAARNYGPVADFSYRHYPLNGFNHRLHLYPSSIRYNFAPLTYDPDGILQSIQFTVEPVPPQTFTPPQPSCQVGSVIQTDDLPCRRAHGGAFYAVTIGNHFGKYKVTETVTDKWGLTASAVKEIDIQASSETKFDLRIATTPALTFSNGTPSTSTSPGTLGSYQSVPDLSEVTYSMLGDSVNAGLSSDYEYRWTVSAADQSQMLEVFPPCSYGIAAANGNFFYWGKSLTHTFDLSKEPAYLGSDTCPLPGTPQNYSLQVMFIDWVTGITIFKTFLQPVGF